MLYFNHLQYIQNFILNSFYIHYAPVMCIPIFIVPFFRLIRITQGKQLSMVFYQLAVLPFLDAYNQMVFTIS